MKQRDQLRWRATLLLMGTIIGAGIFGVPAMIGAWGIPFATIAFAGITLVVLAAHLLYAEAIFANGVPSSRLEAHAARWLGKPIGAFAGATQTLQVLGADLAYLILGGEFLAVLMRAVGISLPVTWWQVIFWVLGATIIFGGFSAVLRAEIGLTWVLVSAIVLLVIVLVMQVRLEDVSRLAFAFPEGVTFEPYGVILFSLLGVTVIPEVVDAAGRRREEAMRAIIRATLATAVLTYAFGVFGWLASGGLITRDPADLIAYLPPIIGIIIPITGFLAIITSFVASTFDIQYMFRKDYHFSEATAWVVSVGTPIMLLFLTPRDFIGTIGFVGAVFSTAIAVVVSLMGYQALASARRQERRVPLFRVLWRRAVPIIVSIILITCGLLWLAISSPFSI